jgi:Pectinacetylesterase
MPDVRDDSHAKGDEVTRPAMGYSAEIRRLEYGSRRLAPRRPRTTRHRRDRNRMTGHPLLTLRRLIMVRLGSNARGRVALLFLLAALATTVAACGGNDDHRGAVASTASATTTAAADQQWRKVVPGGDCECADGSEFAFWERRDDPTKVVFFLDGGGACYDAATCAFTGLGTGGEASYDWSIYGEDPAREGGIFDFARADNPFRDYSFIYVPACTGDAHLGDVTREYSPKLTVEHKGFVNGTAALSYLAENYPDAAQVVIVGKTIGSVAAPVYGGLASDLLPDAQVTVLGGQSGHVPDDPDLNAEFFGERWGAYDKMPDWDVNEGLTARDWGPFRFWIQAGLHDPKIVLARFDYAYDREAAKGAKLLGLDPSKLLAAIDANEAAIEKAGVVLHSYTAPGNGHGIFEWPRFYEIEVNGEKLVDWVTRLIEGESIDDVHCQECRAG